MSKKNSIAQNHKKFLLNSDKILNVYENFKSKINKLKTNLFLVAVSGGEDSLALTFLCKLYEMENKEKNFNYVHINHNLRKRSAREANFVKRLLKKKDIKLNILSNKKKISKNIQHAARQVRYGLLKKFCSDKGINYIITAHHSDDQIETFLIRLSRGSGVQGLSSMKLISNLDNKIKIFRPLLNFKKADLSHISKKVFKSHVKDLSNSNVKFLRVKIRKLKKTLSKYGIEDSQILKSISNLQSTSNIINKELAKIYSKIVVKRKDKYQINYDDFRHLNDEAKLKLFGKIIRNIKKSDYPPRSKKIFIAIDNLSTKEKVEHKMGGCLFTRKRGTIFIEKLVKS